MNYHEVASTVLGFENTFMTREDFDEQITTVKLYKTRKIETGYITYVRDESGQFKLVDKQEEI